MALEEHIGIRVIEKNGGARTVDLYDQSTVAIIGTAPDADVSVFPLGVMVRLDGDLETAAKLGRAGTLLTQLELEDKQEGVTIVVIRVAVGADLAATKANLIGDISTKTGMFALIDAASEVFVEPAIIKAPGFTADWNGVDKNAVATALQTVADKLRAIAIIEIPDTSATDAIAYRTAHGHARTYFISQGVKVFDTATESVVATSATGMISGLIVKRDRTNGTHWSPSNQPIAGIVGVTRPVDYRLSDPACEANLLNKNQINSIVMLKGKLTLLGSQLAASDPQNRFISVRRTGDLIAKSVENALTWAMSQPTSTNLADDVIETINDFLRGLIVDGAILGGEAWWDPKHNSITALKKGAVSIWFDHEVAAPAEDWRIYMARNDDYYLRISPDQKAA